MCKCYFDKSTVIGAILVVSRYMKSVDTYYNYAKP